KRLLDIEARLIAVMAMRAGVRVPACAMPDPRRMREVRAATKARGVMASCPHASADHTTSAPSRSASWTYWLAVGQSALARRRESAILMVRGERGLRRAWGGGRGRSPAVLGGGCSSRGDGGRDRLDLPGVIEIVQAEEEEALPPVERAEGGVLDRGIEQPG